MSSQAELVKTLKVKTGSVKRTHKELTMYEKDREKQQAKVDKLKADNADSHDIKQAVCCSLLCKHVCTCNVCIHVHLMFLVLLHNCRRMLQRRQL